MLKVIRYHLPPFCKTCFSTSESFWHAKNNLVSRHQEVGLGQTPPPQFGNFSHIIPFFLSDNDPNVLLDCGWLVEANHWPETLSKDPNPVFCRFPRGKVSNINIFISIHTANFVLYKLKHQFWVFCQSLKVIGRPQTAYHNQKAHQRRQLLRMPWGWFWWTWML